MNVTVSVVKSIQIRTQTDEAGWNKRFVNAAAAADHYTFWKMADRRRRKWNEENLGAAYHRQTISDIEHERRLSKRFTRFMTMIFKRMLAD